MKSYTADLCDKYTNNIQVAKPLFKSYGGVSQCHGKIVTIKLFEDNSDLVQLLKNTKGDGRICVVDVEGEHCAVVGETLMGYAYENGWSGIVINGYVRDTHQTNQIPVGLFALGTYPLKSIKKADSKQNITLEFAGVKFCTGSTLYADNDGIVVIDKD
jgi:regulator of ribonuclease activity A